MENTVGQSSNRPRKWWIAGLWASIAPPVAFLYTGNPVWSTAGFTGLAVWIGGSLATDFWVRLYALATLLLVGLVYSAIPVFFALARRNQYYPRSSNTGKAYVAVLVIWLAALFFVNQTAKSIMSIGIVASKAGAMENTILPGDFVLVDLRAYADHPPHRGDLVVCTKPRDTRDEDLILRVAALPGDTLLLQNKIVYINHRRAGTPSTAVFADPTRIISAGESVRDNLGPITVAAGEYFLLGDNRDMAEDSRLWGAISRSNIVGRAIVIGYSLDGLIARIERFGLRLDKYDG